MLSEEQREYLEAIKREIVYRIRLEEKERRLKRSRELVRKIVEKEE